MFIFGGCINSDEPIPTIVYRPTERPIPNPPAEVLTTRKTTDKNVPPSWIPPSRLEKRWAGIVIHHSDTSNGSAAIFDDYHKSKLWDGIGYDFVIGNGTNTGNGQVEVTFRWREQRVGAHCKTPDNWANENAVGICLVGNFEYSRPTAKQMESLVKLVRFLQDRYRIPKSRIWGHKSTPGAKVTECPGRMFPMDWLKSKLDF